MLPVAPSPLPHTSDSPWWSAYLHFSSFLSIFLFTTVLLPCHLNMCDQSVFAVLIPYDQKSRARGAFRLRENAHCYHKSTESIADEPTISSREPTPALQSPSQANYEYTDRIVLTFKQKPKDPLRGWQFGTNPHSSDVLLGYRGTKGISGRHFCITITERFRVELQEDSAHGTAVGYNGQAEDEVRKKTTWLLSFEPGTERQ